MIGDHDLGPARSDGLASRVLVALTRGDVPCCYWKASVQLERAVEDASKDLDLLVAANGIERARATLRELGLRRMAPPRGGHVPASEHWVGLDSVRRSFEHVHLHWEIHTGRPPLYEWRLPWEDYLLRHRQRHPSIDAMVIEPALDLTLLAVRAALEPKHREGEALAPATRLDLSRLAAQASRAAIREHVTVLLGPEAAEVDLLGALDDPSSFARWSRAVRSALAPMRIPMAEGRWAMMRGASLARGATRRLALSASEVRRGLRRPERGVIIAVLGPDGAGKTTLTEELARWLGVVFDVQRLYLGRGDWVTEVQQLLAEAKWRALERVAARRRPPAQGPVDDHGTGERAQSPVPKERALQLARDASRVALARRKARDLERAARLRDDGALVVTDRYPHPESQELDGPAIRTAPTDPGWRHALAWLERSAFRASVAVEPDLVIRLRIDPATAHARKPDHRLEDIERKAAALERAAFGRARVVDIDASLPLAEVRAHARGAIWEALCAGG